MTAATSDKPQVEKGHEAGSEQKVCKVNDNAHTEVFDHDAMKTWREAATKSPSLNDGFEVVDPGKGKEADPAKAPVEDPTKAKADDQTAGKPSEPVQAKAGEQPQPPPGDTTQPKSGETPQPPPGDSTQPKPDDQGQKQPGEVTWTTSVGADGTKVQQGSDGTVIQTFQDGTVITTTGDPAAGNQTIAVNKPDGTMMVTGQDDQGRMCTTTITPDGNITQTNPDGTPLSDSGSGYSGVIGAGTDPLVADSGGSYPVTDNSGQPVDDTSGQPVVPPAVVLEAVGSTGEATVAVDSLPQITPGTAPEQVGAVVAQAGQALSLAEKAVAEALSLGERGAWVLGRALNDLAQAETQRSTAANQQMTDEQKKRLLARVDSVLKPDSDQDSAAA